MNKVLIIGIFLLSFIFAKDEATYLNIDASFFEADEAKQILIFTGKVKMTKNKDLLVCEKLVINTVKSKEDSQKQIPKDYKATGNVSFTINTDGGNIIKGKGDTVFYYPNEQKYIIVGNGYLEDVQEGKKVTANKIYIDEKTGKTKIDSDGNEPVKFRLKIEKNEKTE